MPRYSRRRYARRSKKSKRVYAIAKRAARSEIFRLSETKQANHYNVTFDTIPDTAIWWYNLTSAFPAANMVEGSQILMRRMRVCTYIVANNNSVSPLNGMKHQIWIKWAIVAVPEFLANAGPLLAPRNYGPIDGSGKTGEYDAMMQRWDNQVRVVKQWTQYMGPPPVLGDHSSSTNYTPFMQKMKKKSFRFKRKWTFTPDTPENNTNIYGYKLKGYNYYLTATCSKNVAGDNPFIRADLTLYYKDF